MTEIQKLEQELLDISKKLKNLRRDSAPEPMNNVELKNLNGPVKLLDLFGARKKMLVIHNMGQGCRYCTLWADGINAFLPHLEDKFSVVLVSKDSPETQRTFANSRGWRFCMASHQGTTYLEEAKFGKDNDPGVICFERQGDKIFKKNQSEFGPGDAYCSLWHFISLGGLDEETWTPQFSYWKPPSKLDDGGSNIL